MNNIPAPLLRTQNDFGAFSEKISPVTADRFLLEDSEDGFKKVKATVLGIFSAGNLDLVPDGATYIRVVGVNSSHLITNSSIDPAGDFIAASFQGGNVKMYANTLGNVVAGESLSIRTLDRASGTPGSIAAWPGTQLDGTANGATVTIQGGGVECVTDDSGRAGHLNLFAGSNVDNGYGTSGQAADVNIMGGESDSLAGGSVYLDPGVGGDGNGNIIVALNNPLEIGFGVGVEPQYYVDVTDSEARETWLNIENSNATAYKAGIRLENSYAFTDPAEIYITTSGHLLIGIGGVNAIWIRPGYPGGALKFDIHEMDINTNHADYDYLLNGISGPVHYYIAGIHEHQFNGTVVMNYDYEEEDFIIRGPDDEMYRAVASAGAEQHIFATGGIERLFIDDYGIEINSAAEEAYFLVNGIYGEGYFYTGDSSDIHYFHGNVEINSFQEEISYKIYGYDSYPMLEIVTDSGAEEFTFKTSDIERFHIGPDGEITANGIPSLGIEVNSVTSGTTILDSFLASRGVKAVWEISLHEGANNIWGGNIQVVWDGSTIKKVVEDIGFLGDVTGIELTVTMDSSDIMLNAVVTSGTWDLKIERKIF